MLLAVYGSFRKGESRAHVLDELRAKGKSELAEIPGVKLYVMGYVPGAKVTYDLDDKAVVELIYAHLSKKETEDLLEELDRIEGVKHGLYQRNYIITQLGEALIYTFCGSVEGSVEITDWHEWQGRSEREKRKAVRNLDGRAIM